MDNPGPSQRKQENTSGSIQKGRKDIGSSEKVATLVQWVLRHVSDVGLDLPNPNQLKPQT